MKKIVLFMAVSLLAFTEYAKAGKRLPRIPTNVAESTSHVYFDDSPTGQYQAFLTGDYLYQLSPEAFRNIFIAAFDPGHPKHEEAKGAFTKGALDKYVYHLTYLYGADYGVPEGETLTDAEVIQIMEETSFGPAPSNLSTTYAVGRLTSNPNDKVAWFTRSPYKEEKMGTHRGKGWVLTSCGNITRENGGETRTSTRRTSPRTENDDDYDIINTNNVTIRGDNSGRTTRDQRLDITIENTRSNEMTDWEREDIRLKKKMGTQGWINTGLKFADTWFYGTNTYRGIRFEEQRTQHHQTSRVIRGTPTRYGNTYRSGYGRYYEDEDFQGPSPSGGRYVNRSTRYDEYYDDRYNDPYYYDDHVQGGGNTNTWGAVATRALGGSQHYDDYYEEDLRMYNNRRGTNYRPSNGRHVRQASYSYSGRGRNDVLRN